MNGELKPIVEEIAVVAEYLAANSSPDLDFLTIHLENVLLQIHNLAEERAENGSSQPSGSIASVA